jgi:hypothetical protein
MSHCYVDYAGRSVMANEGLLICAMAVVWHESAKRYAEDTDRHRELCDRLDVWRSEAANSGVGMLKLDLQRMLNGDPKKEQDFLTFLSVGEQVVVAFGEVLTSDYLEAVTKVKGLHYQDLPVAALIRQFRDVRSVILGNRQ